MKSLCLMIVLFTLLLVIHPTVHAQTSTPADREILRLGRGTANALAWRPDGQVLAVGGSTGLWFFDENFIQILQKTDLGVRDLKWSPSGNQLAVRYIDNKIKIWQFPNGILQELFVANEFDGASVFGLIWHPNEHYLSGIIDVVTDNTFQLYNILRHTIFADGTDEIFESGAVWWSPDGEKVIGFSKMFGTSSSVRFAIFDAETGDLIIRLEGESDISSQFAWSSDGKYVSNGGSVWDAITGQVLSTANWSGNFV